MENFICPLSNAPVPAPASLPVPDVTGRSELCYGSGTCGCPRLCSSQPGKGKTPEAAFAPHLSYTWASGQISEWADIIFTEIYMVLIWPNPWKLNKNTKLMVVLMPSLR